MTTEEEAKDLLSEAKDKVNCDPDNHHRDFLLADKREESGEEYEFRKVEFHSEVHTAIATNLIEQLQRYISDIEANDDDSSDADETEPIREILTYDVGNYEKSPSPVQHLARDEISNLDAHRAALHDVTVNEKTDFRNPDNIEIQAFRVTSPMQPELVAFKKFTSRQVVGSNFEVMVVASEALDSLSPLSGGNSDEVTEYNEIKQSPVALPNEFDALYYDGTMFVFKAGKFEDMFDYFEAYEEDADEVFSYIEDSGLQIQEFDRVKEIVKNSRNSLRKMRKIQNRGRYDDLDRTRAEGLISEWDLAIYVEGEGDNWQIKIPDFRKVGEILQLLDDNLVVSGMDLVEELGDEHKYLVTGSQESR